MPGTFSQIYIQVVFAVKGRQRLIHSNWEDELFKYITGIITNKGQKLLAINGAEDHLHIFVGLSPSCRLSDLVREIKKSSNAFINEKGLSKRKFEWQKGYGAFSYSQSAVSNVITYIESETASCKSLLQRRV
ncbi:MAG: putative transposase [Nonlabens sp.]|jgi:putative transposase